MISYFLMCIFEREDEEIFLDLTGDMAVLSALLEVFLFEAGIGFLQNNWMPLRIMAAFFGAVYFNVTGWIDLMTGYVYSIINQFFLILFLILLFLKNQSLQFVMISFLLFVLMIWICEKAGAFSRGDSEFLNVSYLFFALKSEEGALEGMFLVMLFSAVLFAGFGKIFGRKEGMIPYTPFLVFSQWIIMMILHFE